MDRSVASRRHLARKRAPDGPDAVTRPEHPVRAEVARLQRAAGNEAVSDLLADVGGTLDEAAPSTPATDGPIAIQDRRMESEADRAARRAAAVEPVADGRSQPDGEPLAPAHQSQLQDLTGADVSQVRLHTGQDAQRSNRQLGAHAYTSGTDIHFGSGAYDPGSSTGFQLLAHEVTHAVAHADQSGVDADGQHLVHAKLKGSHKALVDMGGDKSKSLRKRLHASRWNELLTQLESYEKIEADYQGLLANPSSKGFAKKETAKKAKMLAALTKLEKVALEWQHANAEPDEVPAPPADGGDFTEDARSKAPRRQAVSLFLTRVRMEASDLARGAWDPSSGLDDSQLAWGKDDAVGGGMNRLDQVAYTSTDGAILEGYFKEDKGFEAAVAGPEESVGIGQFDPNYGARSVAMYRLDKLLQGGVIARTEFAVHTSRKRQPDSPSLGEASTRLGFVTEKADGEAMNDLLERGGMAATNKERKRADDPTEMIDAEDPVLQRCLNKLQILDAVAGQLDRHEGNYFVKRDPATGQVLGITGIDNDMAFGSKMTAPDHDTSRFAHNYVGMPELVDEAFGQRILQVSVKDIRDTLYGLLAPAEIEATVSRFTIVQNTIRNLDEKDQLTSSWNAATADDQREKQEFGPGMEHTSLLGRAGEKAWKKVSTELELACKARGHHRMDSEALPKLIGVYVHDGRLPLDQARAVLDGVLDRLGTDIDPVDPVASTPTFAEIGKKRLSAYVDEVVGHRSLVLAMGEQMDRMLGRR